MLPLDQKLPARDYAALALTLATRLAFAAVLFLSPWMIQWFDVQRRMEQVYSGYTDFFVYPSDLFVCLTVIFGLLAVLVAGKKFVWGPKYLTYPLAGLVLLSFLSSIVSVDPVLTLYHSTRYLLLFALYMVLVNVPMPPGWVAIPLALAVLVQGGAGILQFFNQSSLGLQAWGELSLNPADTGVSILRYEDVRILRAYGLTDHPNLLGGFLAFALIFVLGYYFHSAASGSPRAWLRYLLLVPLGVGTVALFYTFSRTAQLALALGSAFMVGALLRDPVARRKRLWAAGLALAVVAGALVVPLVTNQRLVAQRVGQGNAFTENVGEARSLNERDELIASANRVFYQRRLLGVGGGALSLGMFYLDKEFPRDYYWYQPAHLVVLDVAAELGVVGGLLWLWLMAAPLELMWVARSFIVKYPWAAAVSAAVIVMLVVGFFDYYPWFWQPGRIWQWSAWGLFAAVVGARAVFSERRASYEV